jgi:hypothetical protein
METSKISKILVYPFIIFLKVYQKTLSLDHGPLKFLFPHGYCKYYPSCSQYAVLSLKKYGVKGLYKSIKRVLSCTPASAGGIDLP